MVVTFSGKAVIDRFEGSIAVLYLGDEQEKLEIPKKQLPKGVKEGSWLILEIQDGKLVMAEIDPEETARARERIAEKRATLLRGDHLK
jgi:hypothetical protein